MAISIGYTPGLAIDVSPELLENYHLPSRVKKYPNSRQLYTNHIAITLNFDMHSIKPRL